MKQGKTTYNFSKKLFLSLSLLCLLSISAQGWSQVNSVVDTTQIRIGEEIQYTIEVVADSTDLVLFPEGQSFGALEVIESYKVDTSYAAAKTRLIKKYGLTQFDSGNYMIPAQRVYINDRPFSTDSVRVAVQDVPVDTLQQKMFDIKPAIEVGNRPWNLLRLLMWLLPLLALGGGIAYYLMRRKKKKEEQKRQLPPYEEAMTALQELDSTDLLLQQRSKEYYSSLTEIVKRYLHREVDDHALESTSDELIERLQLHKDAGHFEFDTETIKKLDAVLRRADLVKFAKMRQAEGQANADRQVVEEIINETKEVIPEPTEEELLLNQQYLEALQKRKKRRQWVYAISGVFAFLIISGVVYGSVKGMDAVKDIFFSNVTKELAEGRWIKSEYGSPAVVIETPEVLVRQEVPLPADAGPILSLDMFQFGELRTFITTVSTVKYAEAQEVNLQGAMEGALGSLEAQGATNMIVKQGQFETEKGIQGLKSYGTFKLVDQKGNTLPIPYQYEILLFGQAGGLQQIMIAYQENEKYAEGIKNRIVNSVELELTQAQGTQQQGNP